MRAPADIIRALVREGVPPPLCAGRCVSPPAGPVCAFDATGTARTFATLCELEAVSCRESTCKFKVHLNIYICIIVCLYTLYSTLQLQTQTISGLENYGAQWMWHHILYTRSI